MKKTGKHVTGHSVFVDPQQIKQIKRKYNSLSCTQSNDNKDDSKPQKYNERKINRKEAQIEWKIQESFSKGPRRCEEQSKMNLKN